MRLSERRGLSFVEVEIACSIATVVLALLHVVLSGSLSAFSWAGLQATSEAEFLVLREYFSRDVQQASGLVTDIQLEGTRYQTETDSAAGEESTARSLILRLPAIDAQGGVYPGVYDFVIYQMEACQEGSVCVRRQLFTTRAASGDPLIGLQKSARVPDDRIVMRHALQPSSQGASDIPPLFHFDPPSLALAREVTLSVTSQLTGPSSLHPAVPHIATATFRLRNK